MSMSIKVYEYMCIKRRGVQNIHYKSKTTRARQDMRI